MKQKTVKNIARIAFMAMAMVIVLGPFSYAQAASLTSMSDTMSRLKASTASNHEIKFVTPTGIALNQTFLLTFSSGFTGVSSITFNDVDIADAATCGGSYTDKTVAASASTTSWGVSASGQIITLTAPSSSGNVAATNCVRIRIGTNAVVGATGTNQITNGAIGSADTITLGGGASTAADSGTVAVDIISNDQIVVTATVDPTITFTLIDATATDNNIGFGTLTTGAARYANAASTGSASSVSAVTMTVATNASSGYVLSYLGDTLKSGSDSIAVATISADTDGTPGTAQFATAYTANGGSTVATAYANASNNWSYVANTTTTIVSRTTPTNTETIGGYYLANIAGNTPAGSYSTTITYIATGTF